MSKFAALDAAKSSLDFWGNKLPKCPHCGEDFNIDRNDAWHLYSEADIHEVECPDCEQEFQVNTHAVYTFSTDEQERDE